jgi:hypothetical protein
VTHTHVYVARGKLGHKIGISNRVEGRMCDLSTKAEQVTLVRSWEREDAADVEHVVKKLLFVWRSHGFEWFQVGEETMLAAVELAMRMIENGDGLKHPSAVVRRKAA